MFTTWNKSSAELPASFIKTTPNEHQDVPPTWSRALSGSLYSIDSSQKDSLCCSLFRTVWSISLQTTSNQTTAVQEVPNIRVNYKQPKTYTSTPFTLLLSVIGISYLPVIDVHPAGIQGRRLKPVFPTRETLLEKHQYVHSFNRGCGAFHLFYRATVLWRVTDNQRKFLPLLWKKNKKKLNNLTVMTLKSVGQLRLNSKINNKTKHRYIDFALLTLKINE